MTNHIETILSYYDVSAKTGFLPETPVQKLNDKFKEYEQLADSLPILIKMRYIRTKVSELPEFSVDELKTDNEIRRAYSLLTVILNSYVFSQPSNLDNVVPEKIAKPLMFVSNKLGIAPILTHASVDLYNWSVVDSTKSLTLDNLKSITLMTGTEDEERFYLVMVACEALGGPIINGLMSICYSVTGNEIIVHLQTVRKGLIDINKTLGRMREKCKPNIFWRVLRPFLNGSENNPKLPNGLIYNGVNDDKPFYLAGGSAAQSSLFATIDTAFGIEHSDSYFQKIKEYMPKKHRQFIEFVKDNVNVKKCIDTNNPKEVELFEECIQQLRLFRQFHYKLAEDYIIKMKNIDNNVNNDTVLGTGGTELQQFLKKAIDETV